MATSARTGQNGSGTGSRSKPRASTKAVRSPRSNGKANGATSRDRGKTNGGGTSADGGDDV